MRSLDSFVQLPELNWYTSPSALLAKKYLPAAMSSKWELPNTENSGNQPAA